ncbi:MAG TPA: hypothetical protein VHC21_01635 [Candidatus Saccharimonadales bacterium]|nr:hypothetical protein [Candidatus Saccharimonadales bacterium]
MATRETTPRDNHQPEVKQESIIIPDLSAEELDALSPHGRYLLTLAGGSDLHPSDTFTDDLSAQTGLDKETIKALNQGARRDGEVDFESVVMTKSRLTHTGLEALLAEIENARQSE